MKGQRFETVRVSGDRAIIAGHVPLGGDGRLYGPRGKVGGEVSAEEANRSARQVALGMIASLDAAGIDLDRVAWRKVLGMVNAAPGFNALPGVIDGFSDVLLEVFGERGRHSRSAIGVAELPFGVPVEVEAEVVLLPEGTVAESPQEEPGATAEPDHEDLTTLGRPARGPAQARHARAAPTPAIRDPGLIEADYAGTGPLSIPAEALVRSIKALSNLFWISIAGTGATIFLSALTHLDAGASNALEFGEYQIPLSVLPSACLVFAAFVLWLTGARLRMLDAALGDDDLTAGLARDIFRLDPPVLDVFEAGNLRPFSLLSGFSVVLWNWSLFFGGSIGLIFSATIYQGVAASVDHFPLFLLYTGFAIAIMVFGVVGIVPLLRRILGRLHAERLRVGPTRTGVAFLTVLLGILITNPELPTLMTQEPWRALGPVRANAINGESLIMEGSEIIVLGGIEALRPGQTCTDDDGAFYPCGDQATIFLQSLVADVDVFCYVSYPNLGVCVPLTEGTPLPQTLGDVLTEQSLQARMVSAGFAFVEGDGQEIMGQLQDAAQRERVGAWRGTLEPPEAWTGAR